MLLESNENWGEMAIGVHGDTFPRRDNPWQWGPTVVGWQTTVHGGERRSCFTRRSSATTHAWLVTYHKDRDERHRLILGKSGRLEGEERESLVMARLLLGGSDLRSDMPRIAVAVNDRCRNESRTCEDKK